MDDDYTNPTGVMGELFNKLTESIEEIRRTQEQHGRLLQALLQKNNITVDAVVFPPNLKLPFKTVRDLVDGDSFWCDEAVAAKLVDTLVELGGQTLRKAIRRIMEYLMTCDVECSLCLMRPSPGKTALKPLKLYDLIQRLVEELFNKLMQSIEEVREMQEEIQKTQKLHGCLLQKLLEKNNINVSDGIEFPPTLTFPFKTVAELTAAESAWGDDLLATKLVETLAKIGGLTLRKAINRMMDYLLSDAVERQLCFVRPSPGKIAFKPLKLYDLIKRALLRIAATADATLAEVDNEMSKYLISSRDRHGQRHRRRKMAAAALKSEAANEIESSSATTTMLTE